MYVTNTLSTSRGSIELCNYDCGNDWNSYRYNHDIGTGVDITGWGTTNQSVGFQGAGAVRTDWKLVDTSN